MIDIVSDNPAMNFAPYQRVAEAIVTHTRRYGRCSRDDLNKYGFSRQQTDQLWPMAVIIASFELKRDD